MTTIRYSMGENLYLASKWGRNQPFWERLGWRLLHQVINKDHSCLLNWQLAKLQDPGRLNLCEWARYKVMMNGDKTSRRVVFWNDANGSAFVLSPVGSEGQEKHPLIVEDCTVSKLLVNILIVILSIRWLGQHHHWKQQLKIVNSHLKAWISFIILTLEYLMSS